uniref:Apolipoprotein A-IV n=1 Tax=Lates calcarifer TaxID=8187 RepID=A0A4W6EH27_LATCA
LQFLKINLEVVKDAFWDYVAKATLTAEDSLNLNLINTPYDNRNLLISQSADTVNQYVVALRTQVAPLTQDFMTQFTQEAERLKAMDPETLKAVLLQKSQELKAQLDKSVNQLQAQMVPYTEEMKQKMEQSLEEFQSSMIPLAQSFETQLTQKTQEIQQNLAPLGEELKAKLDASAQDLQAQLAVLWESFTKKTQ